MQNISFFSFYLIHIYNVLKSEALDPTSQSAGRPVTLKLNRQWKKPCRTLHGVLIKTEVASVLYYVVVVVVVVVVSSQFFWFFFSNGQVKNEVKTTTTLPILATLLKSNLVLSSPLLLLLHLSGLGNAFQKFISGKVLNLNVTIFLLERMEKVCDWIYFGLVLKGLKIVGLNWEQ